MNSGNSQKKTASVRFRPDEIEAIKKLVYSENSTFSTIVSKLVKIGLKNWEKDAYRKD